MTAVPDIERPPGWFESDLLHDFLRSPVAVAAACVCLVLLALALGADFVAPYNTNDPASANVIDAAMMIRRATMTPLRSTTARRARRGGR